MTEEQQLAWDILSTQANADFKQYRKTHNKTWLTKDRKILLISQMTTLHLNGCMNMLERADQTDTMAYHAIVFELSKRGGRF
jgi:hypothetical protein